MKKTFPKIFWLIASSSIFFILLYSILYFFTFKAEEKVYANTTLQFENEVNELLELETKPIFVTINNDTSWDEFVTYLSTRNRDWYEETISSELDIYNVDYLGVYDENMEFVIRTPTSKIRTKDFIPKSSMIKLDKVGVHKFYYRIPEGIVEITGGSIHPSDDSFKNQTKTSGYFYIVRLIDEDFTKNLELLTKSKVVIKNVSEISENEKDTISCNYLLKDDNGKIIAVLKFERDFAVYFDNTKTLLLVIMFAIIFYLIVTIYYTRKLIYNPLSLVRRVLETGNRRAITKLKESSGEFHHIGLLFDENNKQKSELVNAKIKAEESDRLKSSFLANLSHEIRTPMNAINGFTDLLLNTSISDTEKLEYLSVIEKSGRNLVSIIDDLIEMSKIDSNQVTPNYSSLDLDSCMHEIYETIKVTIKNKDVELKLIQPKKSVQFSIKSDETKLKQILINFLTNALKFTVKGSISFGYSINEKNKLIQFSVIDTGIGIADDHQKVIFDRFKRVENDHGIKVGGLGLGLSITKAYVELLGGSIDIKSKLNIGSEFQFTIPLNYVKINPIIVKPVSVLEIGNSDEITLLIAEDDNINFLLFQKIMQNKNYKIIRAVNGLEAVKICLETSTIDIVLMDIKMPLMDGYEAIEHIRPIRPNLPIIAQTAYSSAEDKLKIHEMGFNDYITKPLNRELLFDIINKHLTNPIP